MAKFKRALKISTATKGFKLEGVPELKKTLNAIAMTLSGEEASALAEKVKQITLKPAIEIRDLAVANAPRGKTGRLKGSIYADVLPNNVGAVIGTKKCYYAPMVEFGTKRNKAHPYLRPAINAHRRTFAASMATDLSALIAEISSANARHPTL